MPKKQMSAEQIVVLLRQIDVQTGQGKTIQAAYRGGWDFGRALLPLPERVRWAGYGASTTDE